jgi:uncharacterized membrane protein YqaE (UPF0057 family)
LNFLLNNDMKILEILLAVFLPPAGVFLHEKLGFHFWLNIVLTLFGYFPGLLHALFIIMKEEK